MLHYYMDFWKKYLCFHGRARRAAFWYAMLMNFFILGKSGLWYLLILVPLVGPVILLIWFCRLGDYGENAYGPDPKVAEMA